MVILIGKAAIIFNMHEGGSYFTDLVRHNVLQARDRLKDWAEGRQIRGYNKHRSFVIDWNDVAQIAVISVVDGHYAACAYHTLEDFGLHEKVRLCATVTSKVMYELAMKGGGARDLIAVCRSMQGTGELSEEETLGLVRSRYDSIYQAAVAEAPVEPTLLRRAMINGKIVPWIEEFRLLFVDLRRQRIPDTEVFSDLSWEEVFRAAAWITSISEIVEKDPNCLVVANQFGAPNCFYVVVTSSMSTFAGNMPEFLDSIEHTSYRFVAIVSLSNLGVQTSLAIKPRKLKWNIEVDLATML